MQQSGVNHARFLWLNSSPLQQSISRVLDGAKMPNVIQGDCLEILAGIKSKSVDLVLIDPPYNIGKDEWDNLGDNYVDWLEQVFLELDRVMKDSGSFWYFHNDFTVMAEMHMRLNINSTLEHRQMIVWNKLFEGCNQEQYLKGFLQVEHLNNFHKMAEYIQFYTRKDLADKLRARRLELGIKSSDIGKEILSRTGGITGWYSNIETGKNYATEETIKPITKHLGLTMDDIAPRFYNQRSHHSVWNYSIDTNKQGHITPKPVDLLVNIISHCTKPGDLVLDCFGGSGSTAIAAIRTNRDYLLIEREPQYIQLINERITREQEHVA